MQRILSSGMNRWIVWCLVLLLVASMGCRDEPERRQVRLKQNLGIPDSPGSATGEATALRVAIAPVLSPRESLKTYHRLLDYLSEQIGQPVQPVQKRTYAEVNALLKNGGADVAFVCTYAYIVGRRDFGLELVAVPQIRGKTTYQSYLIVPATSTVSEFAELKGREFAFSDPLSNSGWLYPRFLLAKMRTTPEAFFGHYLFTYSHDNTLKAVSDGLVDGGAIDSLVYHQMIQQVPRFAETTRVIHESPEFPSPPVVAHPRLLRSPLGRRIQRFFLELHQSPDGREVLTSLGFDRFASITDHDYDVIRQMLHTIENGSP